MKNKLTNKRVKFSIGYVIAAILVLVLLQQLIVRPLMTQSTEISYSQFKTALRAGEVTKVSVGKDQITGVWKDGKTFSTIRVEDADLIKELDARGVDTQGQVESSGGLVGTLLGWLLPLALMAGFYYLMMRRFQGGAGGAGGIGGAGGGSGGIFSFGKSKARVIQGAQSGVTFKDVGGVGEAAVELQEVIEFLKNPARFQRLGRLERARRCWPRRLPARRACLSTR